MDMNKINQYTTEHILKTIKSEEFRFIDDNRFLELDSMMSADEFRRLLTLDKVRFLTPEQFSQLVDYQLGGYIEPHTHLYTHLLVLTNIALYRYRKRYSQYGGFQPVVDKLLAFKYGPADPTLTKWLHSFEVTTEYENKTTQILRREPINKMSYWDDPKTASTFKSLISNLGEIPQEHLGSVLRETTMLARMILSSLLVDFAKEEEVDGRKFFRFNNKLISYYMKDVALNHIYTGPRVDVKVRALNTHDYELALKNMIRKTFREYLRDRNRRLDERRENGRVR